MREVIRLVARYRLAGMSGEELQGVRDARDPMIESSRAGIYRRSLHQGDGVLYLVGRDQTRRMFVAVSNGAFTSPFGGKPTRMEGLFAQEIEMSSRNVKKLWSLFPWTKPSCGSDRCPSFGFGDRLGLATPAHVRAARSFDVFPVFAQQSFRELTKTGRSLANVVADASFSVFQEGYTEGWGADADHVRNMQQVRAAADAGVSMVTFDLSDNLRAEAFFWDQRQVRDAFRRLGKRYQRHVRRAYSGKSFRLGDTSVRIRPEEAEQCAVAFAAALEFVEQGHRFLRRRLGEYDLEVSIDEVGVVTTPAQHLFIAKELESRGLPVASIAPCLADGIEKAIDFAGDVSAFDSDLVQHAAVVHGAAGGYKLSVHSGSDKFSLYPSIRRRTQGQFHLKTSGTSWLEAIRATAEVDPDFYRELHSKVHDAYPEALSQYDISADVDSLPSPEGKADRHLPGLLSDPNWRQLVHISYGGLLGDSGVRKKLFQVLHANENVHLSRVQQHMEEHLNALGVPRR